ncbi:MAG: hypothetical protein ACKOXP_00845 [Flavobacteriales bacterium]
MNFLESIFLDLGFSWTIAKLTPYLLMALLGFILVYTFHSRFSTQWKKWLFMSLLSVLPFIAYFGFYPIYQGDFSQSYYQPDPLEKFPNRLTLTVVVLPGCPYCHESIQFMNTFLQREPQLHIRYLVVAESDETLIPFKEKLDKRIQVIKSKNPKNWIIMAHGGFPCMMLSEHKKVLYAWDNDHFGVRAMDEIIERSK